jgi:hypothetical protein
MGKDRKPTSKRRVDRRHHKAAALPPSVLDELQERLRRGEPYEQVEAWLESIGHPVSKSSLHRYHRFLREGMERIRQRAQIAERIVAESIGHDTATVQAAAYDLAMQQAMEMLIALEAGDEEMSVSQLAKLMHALGAMGGTSTNLSKYRRELRAAKAQADRQVEKMAADGQLPAEAVAAIQQIYGIAVKDS